MEERDKIVEAGIQKAFKEGMIAGVRRFAWWRNGIQYVGACGTTLKKAIEGINKEFPDK